MTMWLTSIATDGLPVSTIMCAVSRYSGSRASCNSADAPADPRPGATGASGRDAGGGADLQETNADRRHAHRRARPADWLRATQHRRRWRQHRVGRRPPGDHRLLDVAKCRLAFTLEEFADGAADALFDDAIGVGKGKSSRCAKRRPTLDLPEPGKPTSTKVKVMGKRKGKW